MLYPLSYEGGVEEKLVGHLHGDRASGSEATGTAGRPSDASGP